MQGHGTARQIATRRTEMLDFIQTMLGQLRVMAEAERCDILAYMIEMAYIEAGDINRGARPRRLADEIGLDHDDVIRMLESRSA